MEDLTPRVSKREKKLHLSYQLPHRVHCSRIYPVNAPNGSTVILYGHDRGLRILWRGGRRPREPSTTRPAHPQTNGISKTQDVIVIDDSRDDEQRQEEAKHDQDQYEDAEDEQDPDCPYPGFVQEVDIDIGARVLHLAIPSIVSSGGPRPPKLSRTHMIVALATADSRVLAMAIPLAPPSSATKADFVDTAIEVSELAGDREIVRDLAVKVVSRGDEELALHEQQTGEPSNVDGQLLVAAIASRANIWSLDLTSSSFAISENAQAPTVRSTLTGSKFSFQASPRMTRLLLVDRGVLRIYDLLAARAADRRPSSSDSTSIIADEATGRIVMSYHTPFAQSKDSPSLARRKKILGAAWVLAGRGILALLEDGEWGIWDVQGPAQSGKNVDDFALRGYLASSSTAETAELSKPKKTASKLAPMTPNTRRTKAEDLFSGASKPSGVAARGGIDVSTSSNRRSGQVDESVMLWYNNDVYAIDSMQTFWQRSSNSGGASGSLYAPGLRHISDVSLLNENITSISQFASKSSAGGLGQMNTRRDLLISAEHRFVISHTNGASTATKTVLPEPAERLVSQDQRMLDAGDLDLGGMDRMLDSMAGAGRTRRVGFAQ